MKQHFKGHMGHIATFIGLFILLSILSLWSWNTLAGLFACPEAKYKHVLAAIGLLLAIRFGIIHSHNRSHLRNAKPDQD